LGTTFGFAFDTFPNRCCCNSISQSRLWTAFYTRGNHWMTFFATTFAFCLAGILDKKVLERKGLRTKFFKLAWVKRIHTSIKKGEKKWINWLLRHNKLLIFVIIFIPFTPWIEGPAVVAARLARIKGALLLLLLASAGKMLLMAFFVYC